MTRMAADDRNRALANAAEEQARALSEDYREMHDLRPAHPVKRDWRGSGRILKSAAFCAAGSIVFTLLALWALHVAFPGVFA